jgi:hypothetical protein
MLPYSLILHGLDSPAGTLPGPLVRDLLDVLDDGAKGAVRLRLEGRSRAAGGTAPAWVTDAAAFELVGLLQEGCGLRLSAATFQESLPHRFEQADLFPAVSPGDTALTVMGASLADALAGAADSEAFDQPLLATFEEFRRVFRHGVESVEIRNGRQGAAPVVITSDGLQAVRRLKRQTPPTRRVRVAGKVDEIRHSDRAFTLVLKGGETLRGVLVEGDPGELASYFGRPAVVSGLAQFRPSGTVLRVDAERLAPASDDDLEIWSANPTPLFRDTPLRELVRPQGPRSGLNAIIGMWPGDETDEEIFALIEEIS